MSRSVEHTGHPRVVAIRSGITSNDSAVPANITDGIGADGTANRKGARVHIRISTANAEDNTTSGIVSVYGGISDAANSTCEWSYLDTLNGGAAITPALDPLGNAWNLNQCYTTTAITAFNRVDARFSSLAGTNCEWSADAIFEEV